MALDVLVTDPGGDRHGTMDKPETVADATALAETILRSTAAMDWPQTDPAELDELVARLAAGAPPIQEKGAGGFMVQVQEWVSPVAEDGEP